MRTPIRSGGFLMFAAAGLLLGPGLAEPCGAQQVAPVSNVLTFSSKGSVQSATGAGQGAAGGAAGGAAASSGAGKTVGSADVIPPSSRITTGKDAATSLILGTAGTARMGAETEVHVPAPGSPHSLELGKGSLHLNISAEELKKRAGGTGSEFRLKTPAAILGVKGTKFFAITRNGEEIIGVHEGSITVAAADGGPAVTVSKGQAVAVRDGKISAPRPLTEEESDSAGQYDAAALQSKPYASRRESPGVTPQAGDLTWGPLAEFNGPKEIKKTKLQQTLPLIRPENDTEDPERSRGVVYTWKPPLPGDGKIKRVGTAPLIHNIFLGARQDEEPIALACRLRSLGVDQASLRLVEKGKTHAVIYRFVLQPREGDTGWMECLVPFPRTEATAGQRAEAIKAKKTGYSRQFDLELEILPKPHAGAVLDQAKARGSVEVAGFSVLALPRFD